MGVGQGPKGSVRELPTAPELPVEDVGAASAEDGNSEDDVDEDDEVVTLTAAAGALDKKSTDSLIARLVRRLDRTRLRKPKRMPPTCWRPSP